MSEPIRYNVKRGDEGYQIAESLGGEWVRYGDYARLRMERIHDLNQIGGLQEENARLKAEVERLRKAGDWMREALEEGPIDYQCRIDRLERRQGGQAERMSEPNRLYHQALSSNRKLLDDYARLKAEVERLRKAGDAMASSIQFNEEMAKDYNGTTIVHQCVQRWNAAKDSTP